MDGCVMTDDIKPTTSKPDEIVTLALDRWKESNDAFAEPRRLFVEDIRFAVLGEQWTDESKELRKGRPCLTENRIPTFIAQVVGDQRQNRPRIKVRPVDSKSDPAVASVLTGIIKNIENVSQAESIRDHAFKQAVSGSWGYYGIHTRYCDEMGFDQEIYHRFIPNPLSVYDDPHAKLPDRSDRKWAFICDTLAMSEFKELYPDKQSDFPQGTGESYSDWFTEDSARIAEYWYVKSEKKKIALLSNGESVTIDEARKLIELDPTITIEKDRETTINKVYSCIISGMEILEGPTAWSGKYIPLIYVGGKEDNIEGRTYVTSLVRWAKDPQRMHNYWLSATTEIIALQPKAPWLLTPKQVEGHERMWAAANFENKPYLLYNNDGSGIPQRLAMNNLPQGAFTMMQSSIDGIKATMGLYDASLGNQSNETSGKAIIARQREGDTATFEFIDNLSKSIAFEGRVIVDLIPKIYDTEKIVRIINPDESEKFVIVNRALAGDEVSKYGVDKKANEGTIYDLKAGKYDVMVESGPSYNTQRMEAADNLVSIIQAAPQLMEIAGDLLFKNLDWPGAGEVATRLKKTLPPGLVEPEEGEQPPAPPQPTIQDQIEMGKLELEKEKLKVELFKVQTQGEETDKRTKAIVLDTISEVFGNDMGMGGMRNSG